MKNKNLYYSSNLKYLRTINNKTQQEVGAVCKKNNTAISNWEKGIREPSVIDLVLLANYFNINIEDFLFKNMRSEGVKRDNEK